MGTFTVHDPGNAEVNSDILCAVLTGTAISRMARLKKLKAQTWSLKKERAICSKLEPLSYNKVVVLTYGRCGESTRFMEQRCNICCKAAQYLPNKQRIPFTVNDSYSD